jgi:hypothetical protein
MTFTPICGQEKRDILLILNRIGILYVSRLHGEPAACLLAAVEKSDIPPHPFPQKRGKGWGTASFTLESKML